MFNFKINQPYELSTIINLYMPHRVCYANRNEESSFTYQLFIKR